MAKLYKKETDRQPFYFDETKSSLRAVDISFETGYAVKYSLAIICRAALASYYCSNTA